MTYRLVYLSILIVLVHGNGHESNAQDDRMFDRGFAGLTRSMKQLQTTVTVLHTVAHPDDEDGPLLAYCARGLGVRTLLFSITRGEGGANLISPHFFDELGALRTLEHLKSAGFYGNELFYSRAADYGYSKTLEEAHRQWQNGEPILADLVEVIRREQPTILLSRFRGDRRDGHGHHQMAGVLTRKAFEAAADPKRFPDQVARGLLPWQPSKLYINERTRGRQNVSWTVSVPTGKFDPVLGRSYAQIARFGLGFQRSQGISGHESQTGARPSYYRLAKSSIHDDKPEKEASILDQIDGSIRGLARFAKEQTRPKIETSLQELQDSIEAAVAHFHTSGISGLVPMLMAAHQKSQIATKRLLHLLKSEPGLQRILKIVDRKHQELNTAILLATGISIEFWVESQKDQRYAIADEPVTIRSRVANPSSHDVRIEQINVIKTIDSQATRFLDKPLNVPQNEFFEPTPGKITFDASSMTRPKWSRLSIREPFYDARDNRQRPIPLMPAVGQVSLSLNGHPLRVLQPIEIHLKDPEFGNVRYPLTLLPKLGVRFLLKHGIIPHGKKQYPVEVELTSASANPYSGSLRLQLPDHWMAVPESHDFRFAKANETKTVKFQLQTPQKSQVTTKQTIRAIATVDGMEYSEGFETVTARDLDRLTLFQPAVHHVSTADIKVAKNLQVAYIRGSGDRVAESLSLLDIFPRILSSTDLESTDLTQFDCIIVGVRAYAVRTDIRRFNHRLIDFVKAGGTLLVQYQTPEFDNNFGPFPYKMGRWPEEVSEEDSTITILQPEHPIFNRPNKITSADFENWFEQRGSKFWASWDERYTPLLECHDTGQTEQQGGMLIAQHGKGTYIYSAYAWYRQLPNGVPGAFRIFANMISVSAQK